jgi:hypothetical protein
VSSAGAPGGQQSEGKGLFELVIATIPTVLLYFVGWAYLYFYLRVFGIGISELDLDIQTIFIYAYPPIHYFGTAYWYWILLTIAAILLARRFAPHRIRVKLDAFYNTACAAPPIAKGLELFGVLVVLAFLSVPFVQSDAERAADRKWISEGVRIEAMVKEPESKEKSGWYDNYKLCAGRRALDLIFSDKDAYYMLCTSSVDETSALVFEVRRDAGLASVRFINGKVRAF